MHGRSLANLSEKMSSAVDAELYMDHGESLENLSEKVSPMTL